MNVRGELQKESQAFQKRWAAVEEGTEGRQVQLSDVERISVLQRLQTSRHQESGPSAAYLQKEIIDKALDPQEWRTEDEIASLCRVDLRERPDVLALLDRNPHVEKNIRGEYRRKTAFNAEIREKDDLLKRIQADDGYMGVEYNKLAESYTGADADLDDLIEDELIVVIESSDSGKRRVCFPLAQPEFRELSCRGRDEFAEFRDLWKSIPRLEDVALMKYLAEFNVSVATRLVNRKRPPPGLTKGRRKKTTRRPTHLVNAHIEGLQEFMD